jgi:cytochrome c-type biogenesis protein CcmF
VLNNLFLATATATVFLGTLYPLFLDAYSGDSVSVGAPFYSRTFVPLMVPLVAAMGVGPFLAWKRADLAGVLGRLKLAAGVAVAAVLAALYLERGGPVLALFGVALAAWLFSASLLEWAGRVKLLRVPLADSLRRARNLPRSAYGMTLAHAGLAVAIAGMTASAAWKTEEILVLRPGDSVQVAGTSYLFEGVERSQGPNYQSDTATITVTRDGRRIARLSPEKRLYPVQNMPTTEAAIHTTGLADLYVALGDSDGQGGWTVRIFHEPLVPWIWAGSLFMVLGGFISLTDRRLRFGAPARRRAARGAGETAKA